MQRLIVALLVASVVTASAVTARADTIAPFRETISIAGSSDCTGDSNIVGTATMIGIERFSVQGHRYSGLSSLAFVAINAVGESGTRYVGTDHEMSIRNGSLADGAGSNLSLLVHDVMVATGGGGVQSFQGMVHVTVNATGTITATSDRFTLACHG